MRWRGGEEWREAEAAKAVMNFLFHHRVSAATGLRTYYAENSGLGRVELSKFVLNTYPKLFLSFLSPSFMLSERNLTWCCSCHPSSLVRVVCKQPKTIPRRDASKSHKELKLQGAKRQLQLWRCCGNFANHWLGKIFKKASLLLLSLSHQPSFSLTISFALVSLLCVSQTATAVQNPMPTKIKSIYRGMHLPQEKNLTFGELSHVW